MVPLPFTVEQYRVGHAFALVQTARTEQQDDTKVELLSSAATTHPRLGPGTETRRRFHFGARLPAVVRTLLGGAHALVVEERAVSHYPYVEAVYRCPLFGDRFAMSIQTLYCTSRAAVEPQYAALLQRTRAIPDATVAPPITVDICAAPATSVGSMYDNPYVAAEDPAAYGLRSGFAASMVAVKVVWVRLALPLVGASLERRAIASAGDVYHRLHRRAYAWYHGGDAERGWQHMTLEDVRALEQRTKIRSKL